MQKYTHTKSLIYGLICGLRFSCLHFPSVRGHLALMRYSLSSTLVHPDGMRVVVVVVMLEVFCTVITYAIDALFSWSLLVVCCCCSSPLG